MMERAPFTKTHMEEERKRLIEEDHTMIRYPYNDGIRKHLTLGHSMTPSINIDNLSPKRTPEDRV